MTVNEDGPRPTWLEQRLARVLATALDFQPRTSAEWCTEFRRLDREHHTSPDSPLHHDQRCVLQYRDTPSVSVNEDSPNREKAS